MTFKHFRIVVTLRVLFIMLLIWLLFYLVNFTKFYVSAFIVFLIIAGIVADLIFYLEKTNRKFTQFLESIRHSDFTLTYSDRGKGKSFDELNAAFNEVINEFKKNRTAKEEQFSYLQTIVQHISIGILVFQKDGKVDLLNNAIKRLLKINNLRNIKELQDIDVNIADVLSKMKAGDSNLIKMFIDNEIMQLSINATEFKMRGDDYTLVSIQNIHQELEEKEMDSWQKLIRVLTHEIMNSITPISSLASTVKDLLLSDAEDKNSLNDLDVETIESARTALQTIEKRSQGLLNFVEIYRNLTRIPKPNFRYVPAIELFNRVEMLLKPKIEQHRIAFEIKIFKENMMLTIDPDLMEQVLINLLINSIDAVKGVEKPHIKIIANQNFLCQSMIIIEDNGYGIKPDILDKIFIPFFTSKKEGSGIGLSLSRQIMRLHKGSISVKSIPKQATTFSLIF